MTLDDRLRVLAHLLDEAAEEQSPTQLLTQVVANELRVIADDLAAGEQRIAETLR